MSHDETSPFGRGLRHWRRLRRVSQLELASTAATTTRHLSFLETGRSRPSLVRTITVAAKFESVADITLDEVRVELIYPEDEPSERFFLASVDG